MTRCQQCGAEVTFTDETGNQERLALADEYERGLKKMEAAGYEEFLDVIPKHKLIIAALRGRYPDGTGNVTAKKMLDLLQCSTCFRGDVCSMMPCACAQSLADASRRSPAGAVKQEAWALLYLHDWDPPKEGQEHKWESGKNVFPEIHAIYETWQEAENIKRKMTCHEKYWVRRVHGRWVDGLSRSQPETVIEYLDKSIASFVGDPPDSDFQRGFLQALRVVRQEAFAPIPSAGTPSREPSGAM